MKNLGMNEPEQYMAAQRRPRHDAEIATSAHHCTVMLSASETSLAIALFRNQNDLRFFASLRMIKRLHFNSSTFLQ